MLLTYVRNRPILYLQHPDIKEVPGLPRPRNYRQVCHFPQTLAFLPEEQSPEKPPVILTVDEYEAIRLIDREGLSQE